MSVSLSHADIPDTCIHYVGGFLDALIQRPKEVRALGSNLYKWVSCPPLSAFTSWGGQQGVCRLHYFLSQGRIPGGTVVISLFPLFPQAL